MGGLPVLVPAKLSGSHCFGGRRESRNYLRCKAQKQLTCWTFLDNMIKEKKHAYHCIHDFGSSQWGKHKKGYKKDPDHHFLPDLSQTNCRKTLVAPLALYVKSNDLAAGLPFKHPSGVPASQMSSPAPAEKKSATPGSKLFSRSWHVSRGMQGGCRALPSKIMPICGGIMWGT